MDVALPTLQATEQFGAAFARALARVHPGAFLLYGSLGAGKTTLTRAIVSRLPGADGAEISSPSFTICNIYCTVPPVHHYDLYRLSPGSGNDALEDSLEDPGVLTLVEWSERLARCHLPLDGLQGELRLVADDADNGFPGLRILSLKPLGPKGTRFIQELGAHLPKGEGRPRVSTAHIR